MRARRARRSSRSRRHVFRWAWLLVVVVLQLAFSLRFAKYADALVAVAWAGLHYVYLAKPMLPVAAADRISRTAPRP